MIGEGTRQFDLYDFFSIFIPGAAILLAFAPFLPRGTSLPTLGVLGLVLIGGFVVGRVVHATRIWIESAANLTTHRQFFIDEVDNPTSLDENLVKSFYKISISEFDHTNFPTWDDVNKEDNEGQLNTLYTLTRSAVHIDSRGRSRTFQAIYDFYTSMLIGSSVVASLYIIYSLIQGFNILSTESVGFTPYIATLDIHWLPLVLLTGTAYLIIFFISRQMHGPYRSYFINYLMSDFIILHNEKTDKNKDRN